MTDVFLERKLEPKITVADCISMARTADSCFSLHKVDWVQSLLSFDGGQMFCHFSSPDAESVRIGLRQVGADISNLWTGTIHDRPNMSISDLATANVVVERSFDLAVHVDEIQAIEDAGAWCLETHRVRFIRTYFSADKKHMICLYQASDAESVRLAQQQAQMPFDRIWSFVAVRPEDL